MSNQHRYNTRSSAARGSPSQNRVDNHQHDPSFDYSSSSRSSERSAVSSYNSSGQEVLHPYDTQHDNPDPSRTRDNNHDESNSPDSLDPYPTRDNNQDLRPDANAPFGYRLDVSGKKRPAPDDPNQLCLVRERDGAHTDKTRREIEDLSGYWSITPNGTRYFHRTTPFEVC